MIFRSIYLVSWLLLLPSLAWAGGPFQPTIPEKDARYSVGTPLDADSSEEWWTSLEDPILNDLVNESLQKNHDIGAAQARFHASAGVTLQSASPLLPSASFDVGLNARPSANAAFQVPPQLTELLHNLADLAESVPGQTPSDDTNSEEEPDLTWNGSALFNFGINIDMGRSATSLRAAQLDAAAAKDDRDGVARAVVQQVVAAWLDLRTARVRITLIEGQITTNSSLLELTQARFLSSEARGLDVLQQQQQLEATRALLPQAQQILRLRELQLATLLGRDPSAPGLPSGDGLPELPSRPGLGTPADLMETRPALAAASNRYRSANNRVASAALGFAPTFRITGNIGYQLRWFNEWDSQETWGLGAGVSIPIFGGLQRIGALKQAIASRDAAARSLSATAIQAQGEVERALVREDTEAARLTALSRQLEAAQVAYEESLRQYAGGLTNHITVLSSLSSWQAAELNHLPAQRDVLGARIDLHTALGAPWAHRLNSVGGAR